MVILGCCSTAQVVREHAFWELVRRLILCGACVRWMGVRMTELRFVRVIRCRNRIDPEAAEDVVAMAARYLPGAVTGRALSLRRIWWWPWTRQVLVVVTVDTGSSEAFAHTLDGVYGALGAEDLDPVVLDPRVHGREYAAARTTGLV